MDEDKDLEDLMANLGKSYSNFFGVISIFKDSVASLLCYCGVDSLTDKDSVASLLCFYGVDLLQIRTLWPVSSSHGFDNR
uniref:Uncharacterized protein n=1 Tax=Timema genevievae TaxID=629358 RepID=A0A7R9PLG5_TIMGE|nr:unnamed protein product [Timema genevievae]